MSINTCPHCNNYQFGFWAKVSLSPRRKRQCQSCRGYVSVSKYRSALHLLTLGVIPLIFCLLAISITNSSSRTWWLLPVAGIVIGVLLELWLYYRSVPLVARAA
jgi:hypothetical protein